jgi:hypothetical protein
MEKTWEDLTQPAKIESLHRDIERIFALLKEIQAAVAQDQSALKSQIDGVKPWGPFLNDLQQRIEKIEGQK